MSDFFPEPPAYDEPPEDPPQPVWLNPPEDMLPGVVPVELVLGRSAEAAVLLTGMRVFPIGVAMTLMVRTRGRHKHLELHEEVFDGPHRHSEDGVWQRDRFKWGFEFADGRRATNVDVRPRIPDEEMDPVPPVLSGGGGGGGPRSVDRDYWLWPLPPPGVLKVVCQWPRLGIQATRIDIDASEFTSAATRARKIWAGD